MKVGDLVRWVSHRSRQCAGLGIVVNEGLDRGQCPPAKKYKIMWHIDIGAVDGYSGTWYYEEDYSDGRIVKV